MRFRIWLLFIVLLLAEPDAVHSEIENNNYGSAFKQILLLSQSEYVRTIQPGRSHDGRAIPAYVISDYTVSPANKTRILICSGQHGNEFNPVKSVIQLSRKLGSGEYADLLRKCAIVIVPIVNPDGVAAFRRTNAANIDINRDWAALSAVETRYVDDLIDNWKPQVLIDVHEWTEPAPSPEDRIELAWAANKERRNALARLAIDAQIASGLKQYQCGNHSDPNLFHRRYSSLGYASYLLETRQFESFEKKNKQYQSAILAVIEKVCAKPKLAPLISPASGGFNINDVAAYLKESPASDNCFSGRAALAGAFIACLCLLMFVSKTAQQKRDTRWSRKYVNCELPGEIKAEATVSTRGLQPLLYKSWVNRRIRSRYIRDSKIAIILKDSECAGESKPSNSADLDFALSQNTTPKKRKLINLRLVDKNSI